jgi:hypothetical protein
LTVDTTLPDPEGLCLSSSVNCHPGRDIEQDVQTLKGCVYRQVSTVIQDKVFEQDVQTLHSAQIPYPESDRIRQITFNLQENLYMSAVPAAMSNLGSLLRGSFSKDPPPDVASDEVYPVHMLDSNTMSRSIIVAWTLIFHDVLDAGLLHQSLLSLLEMEGWRKLGGRLRLNVSSCSMLFKQY